LVLVDSRDESIMVYRVNLSAQGGMGGGADGVGGRWCFLSGSR